MCIPQRSYNLRRAAAHSNYFHRCVSLQSHFIEDLFLLIIYTTGCLIYVYSVGNVRRYYTIQNTRQLECVSGWNIHAHQESCSVQFFLLQFLLFYYGCALIAPRSNRYTTPRIGKREPLSPLWSCSKLYNFRNQVFWILFDKNVSKENTFFLSFRVRIFQRQMHILLLFTLNVVILTHTRSKWLVYRLVLRMQSHRTSIQHKYMWKREVA